MTDYSHIYTYDKGLRGDHSDKLRALQQLAEECVFDSLNRTEVISQCLAIFPHGCIVHPYTLNDAILLTSLDQNVRNVVRQHLLSTLICSNALNRYDQVVGNTTTTEAIASFMYFAPYEMETFWHSLARLDIPLEMDLVIDAVYKRHNKVPVPNGWRFEGVSVGTRSRRDAWVNPVEMQDAWCHNYLDEQLREYDAHVYTTHASLDPHYRRFVVRSTVHCAQTYFTLGLPVVFYYRLPNGMRYGYCRQVEICRMCLVDRNDPMHTLRKHTCTYKLTFTSEHFPCLDIEGMVYFYSFLFNDGTGRPHIAAYYAVLAHVTPHVNEKLLMELDSFDPFHDGTPPNFLVHLLTLLPTEFRREIRHIYRATVDALIASFMMSHHGPHVTFVTPFTIEDHTV